MSGNHLIDLPSVRTLTVVGAGTMGHGIAHVAAMSGFTVVLSDISQEAIDSGLGKIRKNLDKGVELGKVAAVDRDRALASLSGVVDLATAAKDADVIIEAAPESLELKRSIFRTVDAAAPGHALLATNTSSLSVASIAESVREPGRMVGMHFFNPVHIMKLVEVVRHDGSTDAAVGLARALTERFGKTGITVKDTPGFASSRLGLVIGLEAMRMVEAGVASAADIDTAMKLGYGHPMGPLELTDLVGLDVRLSIADYLSDEIGPAFAAPDILRAHVAAGRLGKKTGEGFYRWKDGKRAD